MLILITYLANLSLLTAPRKFSLTLSARVYPATITINSHRPYHSFIEFDITEAVRNWKSGDPNYGLLLMATNENTNGRDIRFASNGNSNENQHAYVNVLCN